MLPKAISTAEDLLLIINTLPLGVLIVNEQGNISFSNDRAEQIFGFEPNELIGLSVHNLVSAELRTKHVQLVEQFYLSPSNRAMESGRLLTAVHKDGSNILVQIGLSPVTVDNLPHTLVSIIDAKNPVLKAASHHDALTGLPNRVLFDGTASNLRNLAIRNKQPISMMFIDLDHFKQVNDHFGHQKGDTVLCEVADILLKNTRKNDIASRIGGDEFIIFFYGVSDSVILQRMAKKIISDITAINNTFPENNDNTTVMSASIGILHIVSPAELSLKEMINKSDALMYRVKNNGKGTAHLELFSANATID